LVGLWDPAGMPMNDEKSVRLAVGGAPKMINAVLPDGSLLSRDGRNRRNKGSPFAGLISRIDTEGNTKKICDLFHGGTSLATDSTGNIYTVDGPGWPDSDGGWGQRMDYTFPSANMHHWALRSAESDLAYSRGETITSTEYHFDHKDGITKVRESAEHVIRHKAEVAYLVKFDPEGGERGSENEQWALRGAFHGQVCAGCDTPQNLLACDGADRLILGDVDHCSVKVVDTAGNLITRFGRFGNAETLPGPDGSAKQLGFRNIYSVAATGEYAYISDRDLRRIAIIRMDYRDSVRLPVAP